MSTIWATGKMVRWSVKASYLCLISTHTAVLSINYPMETVKSSSSIDRSPIKAKSAKVQLTVTDEFPTIWECSSSKGSYNKADRKKDNSTSSILKATRKNSQLLSTIIHKPMPPLTTKIINIMKDKSTPKRSCLKVKVACYIPIKTFTKANGSQENIMAMVLSIGLTDLAMKVNMKTV